ncbi:Zinc-regulated transporter 2 [Fusarium oxysporum f. sp. albedinis]|nr:Zinc-regulated transporter 2 [Fusarium oxysporum f. sp. albedinis]
METSELQQSHRVIGLVVKFSVAIRAASGSPGFDSLITHSKAVIASSRSFCGVVQFLFALEFVQVAKQWYPACRQTLRKGTKAEANQLR